MKDGCMYIIGTQGTIRWWATPIYFEIYFWWNGPGTSPFTAISPSTFWMSSVDPSFGCPSAHVTCFIPLMACMLIKMHPEAASSMSVSSAQKTESRPTRLDLWTKKEENRRRIGEDLSLHLCKSLQILQIYFLHDLLHDGKVSGWVI